MQHGVQADPFKGQLLQMHITTLGFMLGRPQTRAVYISCGEDEALYLGQGCLQTLISS